MSRWPELIRCMRAKLVENELVAALHYSCRPSFQISTRTNNSSRCVGSPPTLFSPGRQVARSANARRLIAVRLNRGHDFSQGVEGVKTEISPSISEFAPDASAADEGGPGIPIMAVSFLLKSASLCACCVGTSLLQSAALPG